METTTDTEPVIVTLRFKNRADRDHFMSGLSDGWGENACDLDWGQRRGIPRGACSNDGINFYETDAFGVTP